MNDWYVDLMAIGALLGGALLLSAIITLVLSVLAIWAVNVLFSLDIGFTLETVFAAMVLVFVFRGAKISFNKS